MQNTTALVCLANLLFATGTAVAADLFVAPGGGPGTYGSIGAAVDAACPGDRIHVAAGDYFEGFTVSKSLTILAAPGAVLHHPSPDEPKPLLISKLQADDRVVISGLAFRSPTEAGPKDAEFLSIRALNNKGTVVLHALDIQPAHYNGLLVESSAQVLLLDSTLTGSLAADACVGSLRPLVRVSGSTLMVADSEILASSASTDSSPCPFAGGGVALLANYSKVVLSKSLLRGGAGSNVSWGVLVPGAAMVLSETEVELRSSVALGGDGAAGTPAPGAIGAGATGKSVLLLSQESSVTGGTAGDGYATSPGHILLSGAIASTTGVLFPSLELLLPETPTGALGQPVRFGLRGHPGDSHYLFLAPGVSGGIQFPGVAGECLLGMDELRGLGVVLLDGSGTGAWDAIVPNNPALVGLTTYFQNLAPMGPTPAFGNVVLVPIGS